MIKVSLDGKRTCKTSTDLSIFVTLLSSFSFCYLSSQQQTHTHTHTHTHLDLANNVSNVGEIRRLSGYFLSKLSNFTGL